MKHERIKIADGSQPWSRLDEEGETQAAWEAGMCYLRMGGARSLRGVSLALAEQEGGRGRSLASISRWSRRWRWAERAADWDRFQAEIRAEADEYAARRLAADQADQWVSFRTRVQDGRRLAHDLVLNRLNEIAKKERSAKPAALAEIGAVLDLLERTQRMGESACVAMIPDRGLPGVRGPVALDDDILAAGMAEMARLKRAKAGGAKPSRS